MVTRELTVVGCLNANSNNGAQDVYSNNTKDYIVHEDIFK